MHLNPPKCSYGVQESNFLGIILTKRGIKANLDKCHTVIGMGSHYNDKEVQQLVGSIATLSHFLSCTYDKAFSLRSHSVEK